MDTISMQLGTQTVYALVYDNIHNEIDTGQTEKGIKLYFIEVI